MSTPPVVMMEEGSHGRSQAAPTDPAGSCARAGVTVVVGPHDGVGGGAPPRRHPVRGRSGREAEAPGAWMTMRRPSGRVTATVGEERAGQRQVGGPRRDRVHAHGRPHVPRRERPEVVVARLVGRRVARRGCRRWSGPPAWARHGRPDVVVLPRRPQARLVAGPVVGEVAAGVERGEEGVELGHGGGVARPSGWTGRPGPGGPTRCTGRRCPPRSPSWPPGSSWAAWKAGPAGKLPSSARARR